LLEEIATQTRSEQVLTLQRKLRHVSCFDVEDADVVVGLTRAFKASKLASVCQIANPTRNARGSPSVRLEQMFDLPLDIEAPDRLVRAESERLERDGDFDCPTVGGLVDGCIPDSILIARQILRVVGYLSIRPCAGGIDLKEESVAMIKKWIDDDSDTIVHIEIGVAQELR
jgi:hypothetical protein